MTLLGWITQQGHGDAVDSVLEFQAGEGLTEGWMEGVLQMREGEWAMLHFLAASVYGDLPMGSLDGWFYIPVHLNVLFNIEMLGKADRSAKLECLLRINLCRKGRNVCDIQL